LSKLFFKKLSRLSFDKSLFENEERIKGTILEKYNTIIFDLDRTLWNCFTTEGQEIGAYQTIPPYVLQSENIVVDSKGSVIQLQEGVRELLESLDSLDKNLGIVSRGQTLIDVDKRIEVPFSAQPSAILLKKFDLYKYFNMGVTLKAFEDKKFYVKQEGKTLFIDDDKRWLESVNQREDIDVLNRKSFKNWEDLLRKVSFSKLSWKMMSEEFYEFEDFLRKNNIEFYEENEGFIITHKGDVDLPNLKSLPDNIQFNNNGYVEFYNLTSLPDNIQFNNKGDVYLSNLTSLHDNIQFNNNGYVYLSNLTSLPDNIQFNNNGYVYLHNLTSLPDNVQFNNKGDVELYNLLSLPNNIQFNNKGPVNLYRLESLPMNKYEIFKNDGIINYNYGEDIFDPRQKQKLSFTTVSADINEWLETGLPFLFKKDSKKLYVGHRGQSHGELGKDLYDHGLKFKLYTYNYPYYPSDEEFLMGRINSTKTKVGFYAKEDEEQILNCLFELLQQNLINKDTRVFLDEQYSYNDEGVSVREVLSNKKRSLHVFVLKYNKNKNILNKNVSFNK